jgi:hypothetical protein
MITILHGSHTEASRSDLMRRKNESRKSDIRTIDGKTADDTAITQALESTSLFGSEVLVILERVFQNRTKTPKRIQSLAKILAGCGSTDVIIWEEKELTPSVLNAIPGADVRLFAIPPQIFSFLDSIKPGAGSILLSKYSELIRSEAPEFIFSMLAKRLRQLILVTDSVTPPGMKPWQVNRLTTQANSFTMEQHIGMYKRLCSIEREVRSGTSAFSLEKHTELFLCSL